jgi:hypothetical protein
VRKKPTEPDIQDTLEHILTICTIYECSSDKVGRITQYTKHVLEEVKANKRRTKDGSDKPSSKTGCERKRGS